MNLIKLLPPTPTTVYHYLLSVTSIDPFGDERYIICNVTESKLPHTYRGAKKSLASLVEDGIVSIIEEGKIVVGFASDEKGVVLYGALFLNPVYQALHVYLTALAAIKSKRYFVHEATVKIVEQIQLKDFWVLCNQVIFQDFKGRSTFSAKELAQFKKLSVYYEDWETCALLIIAYLTTTSHTSPTIGAVLTQKDRLYAVATNIRKITSTAIKKHQEDGDTDDDERF